MTYQDMWDLAMMIERCRTDNVDQIDRDDSRLPTVRLSRSLSNICRRDTNLTMGAGRYISLEDILMSRQNNLTLGKLLAVIYTSPKARFQISFRVYCVSGQGQRRFLAPVIGIRATQGHFRDDVGLDVPSVSQERLRCDDQQSYDHLPIYCVHGTSIEAWHAILSGQGP